MATLSEDLKALAALEDDNRLSAGATAPEALSEELKKINWARLVCFAIPIYNMIAPFSGMPPMPVPAFCSNPAPATEAEAVATAE